MRDMTWNDDCLVGIPAFDLQHKGIFDCFVTMAAEVRNKHDRFLAPSSYARLVDLLEQNLALEASMLRSFDYPELERHIEEHHQFHADLDGAARKCFDVDGGETLEMARVFRKWQTEHIMRSDRHYIEHLAGTPALRSAAGRSTCTSSKSGI